MNDLQELIAKNRAWAEAIKANDPDFFNTLAQQQTPSYLWIGCSVSHVPATQLIGLRAGDLTQLDLWSRRWPTVRLKHLRHKSE